MQKDDVWSRLSAPVPAGAISWRADGKASARAGKFYARFVAYVDAQFVRERLDSVVGGNWDLTLELLPPNDVVNQNGVVTGKEFSFKARLQIMGVIREDVGTGDDYKSASSDAFKRVAVRFGLAHELYSYEQNWVEVDGDGKYAKPVEDPNVAYQRRYGSGAKQSSGAQNGATPENPGPGVPAGAAPAPTSSSKSPTTRPMPFGKTKGQQIGSLSDTELEKTAEWCRSKDATKFKDLIADIETVLNGRARRPVATAAGVGAEPDSYPSALEETDDDLPF